MPKQLLRRSTSAKSATLAGFDLTVRHSSRRRTLTIRVDEGKVVAMAPTGTPLGDIERFLHRKSPWIREVLDQQQAQLARCQRQWRSGEELPFLGHKLQLQVETGGRGAVERVDNQLRVTVPASAVDVEAKIQRLVQKWYRQQAEQHCAERLQHLQLLTGIRATSLAVRTYKARWGSCSREGDISLNWKLMMAPPEVLDYVMIHELCHRIHFNHSPAYWQLVSRFEPAYKSHKAWLKKNGLALEL